MRTPLVPFLSTSITVLVSLANPAVAQANPFDEYTLVETWSAPAGASFDALPDGRLIAVDTTGAVQIETAPGSRSFATAFNLPNPDFSSFGAAFISVSPDGGRIAVGNNGGASFTNFEVGVFDITGGGGDWFPINHVSAAWFDDQSLAISGGSFTASNVSVLDVSSNPAAPSVTLIVDGVAGASAGVAFDAAGNLYTGNGFAAGTGSDTGAIKAFAAADWQAALAGAAAPNFETDGAFITDLLSAGSLGFDNDGNLHVGGGDLFGSGDGDYAALVRSDALDSVLAGGSAIDPLDATNVRRFDPDAANTGNFYGVSFNAARGELYIGSDGVIYTYVPEPAAGLALLAALGVLVRRQGRGV